MHIEYKREILRKIIHIQGLFLTLLSFKYPHLIFFLLFTLIIIYIIVELSRLKGKNIFFLTDLILKASRERDNQKKIIKGPITLALGLILSLLIFPAPYAQIAMLSLSLGDGFSSLMGRLYGKIIIPLTDGKTLEGSLACFIASFIGIYFINHSIEKSLGLALISTSVELLPIKDFDNIIIPLVVGLCSYWLF